MEIERTHVKVNERFKTDEIVRSGTLFDYRGRVGRRERRREDEQEGEDNAMVRAMGFAVSAMALDHMWAYYFKGQL
jgi:hypothetical protein